MGFWWRDINVALDSYSNHHFDVNVQNGDGVTVWKAMGIYGWSDSNEKHRTWHLMRSLWSRSIVPVVMFGDFNEITSMTEKDGGVMRGERQMDGLDRFLANDGWCDLFPFLTVVHLPIYRSDHAPILLKAEFYEGRRGRERLFHFESLLLSSEECVQVVRGAWNEGENTPITSKLGMCAEKLSSWVAATFWNIKKKIRETEKKLKEVQRRTNQNNSTIDYGNMLSLKLDDLHKWEESYWYARARTNELRDRDKNTKYFHHKESLRKKRNFISGLYDEEGNWSIFNDEESNCPLLHHFPVIKDIGGPLKMGSSRSNLATGWAEGVIYKHGSHILV
ncbi:Helicase SWR1 [Bienertia sinuspersici]